jgi:hypothetical protein
MTMNYDGKKRYKVTVATSWSVWAEDGNSAVEMVEDLCMEAIASEGVFNIFGVNVEEDGDVNE